MFNNDYVGEIFGIFFCQREISYMWIVASVTS